MMISALVVVALSTNFTHNDQLSHEPVMKVVLSGSEGEDNADDVKLGSVG